MSYQRVLASQLARINSDGAMWAFPLAVTAGWLLWPAVDYEWKMELGLAPDPEATINRVHQEKLKRYDDFRKANGKPPVGAAAAAKAVVEEEEEEEEEAAADEDEVGGGGGGDDETGEEGGEEGEGGGGDEDGAGDEAGAGGEEGEEQEDGEEEEDEEDDEPKKPNIPPLYMPNKDKKLGLQDQWDNFTLKALNYDEDDDDDDEDDDDE